LVLAGCNATDVDVYVATSQVTTAADGSQTSITSTLDDAGNAVATSVSVAGTDGGEPAVVEFERSFNTFGVADAADGGSVEAEYDDYGQPVSLVYTDAYGTEVASRTYTYTSVRGHIRSEEFASSQLAGGSFAYSVTYDQNDGWPIEGTLSAYGTTVDVAFTYEVDENGAVLRQIISLDGEQAADFSFEHDENGNVSSMTAQDGSTTVYTYELVDSPSPYAMANALVHPVDFASLAELLAPAGAAV
jgi:hypothetical protein